jgi:glycosyltransferase involved in cell wall biosynthesis
MALMAIKRLLLQVGATTRARRRSGIHRVTVELARVLPKMAPTDFVCWDVQAGGLRYADLQELDALFGPGDWPEDAVLRPNARQTGRRFRDELDDPAQTWLLDPEIGHHGPGGLEAMARRTTQLREYGVRTAAVGYDLIPLNHPEYAADRPVQTAYANELLRTDLLLAISQYTADDFAKFWRTSGAQRTPHIVSCPLPDGGFSNRASPRPQGWTTRPRLLMVGTVEPRKRQIAAVEAFAVARRRSPAVAAARLQIIGSLHPAVATRFQRLVNSTPGVEYLDYAPEWMLNAAFETATATIFASEEEGYGLPIAESLSRGLPCLCADFGAMAEIAKGGGCLSVDVRNPAALEAGIIALCEDKSLEDRLRAEIDRRAFSTWADYAAALIRRMDEAPTAQLAAPADTRIITGAPADIARLPPAVVLAAVRADVVGLESPQARTAFIDRVEHEKHHGLLPSRIIVAPEPELSKAVELAAAEIQTFVNRLDEVRDVEAAYAAARRHSASAPCPVFLRIAISTFNRRDFTLENVRWILDKVLRPGDGVELVVVDGGSTDGTLEALAALRRPRLKIIVSPTNTGMLGGFHDVSVLSGAEYVWVVGDDDFIIPEEFPVLLEALRRNAGVPLGFVNFGVYHRASFGMADTATSLINERVPLAPTPSPSGLRPIRRIAEEHDNLFTAIYTIIWRADVLAAAYDYTFDGVPFIDLVESIPCTKIVLESFAACEGYWHAPIGIVSNAHNGWSRHRPRWHGLLMPQALALARDAGLDHKTLQAWAQVQHDLFDEAMALAHEAGRQPQLTRDEAQLAHILYRRELNGLSQ